MNPRMGVKVTAATRVELTTVQRLVTGGLGALTPVLLSLLVVDLRTTFQSADGIAAAGYVVRILALFAVGGVAAWLHKSEFDRAKLFQLGMAGPALLTTFINGTQVATPAADSPASGGGPGITALVVTPVYAQQDSRIYTFGEPSPRKPAAGARFVKGLVGYSPAAGEHFVVLTDAEYADDRAAIRRQVDLRRRGPAFGDVMVFRNPVRNSHVLVTAGWVGKEEAIRVLKVAQAQRLPAVIVTPVTAASVLSARLPAR